MMKIVAYLLVFLLIAALGAGAYFYLNMFKPMTADYERMKTSMPELEKAKTDLKKYRERENQETAWLNPAVDAISTVLADEIKTGKAEVLAAGNKVVINISELALYMPGSYTFTQESRTLLVKLNTLLSSSVVKGKELSVGNTTEGAPARGKGRKRIPSKDARMLAADRSAALVKYLEKNGVNQDTLIAAAYSAKQPEIGFKIKNHKTVIIIENPPTAPLVAKQDVASTPSQVKPTNATNTMTAPEAQSVPPAQPKPIPIQPAQPKPK